MEELQCENCHKKCENFNKKMKDGGLLACIGSIFGAAKHTPMISLESFKKNGKCLANVNTLFSVDPVEALIQSFSMLINSIYQIFLTDLLGLAVFVDFTILFCDFCAVAYSNVFVSEIFLPISFDMTSSNITSVDLKSLRLNILELILLELKTDIDFLNLVDNITHLFQYIGLINLGNISG